MATVCMEKHYVFPKDVDMTSESLMFLWKTWQRHWEDVVFSWKMLHLIEKYKYVQFLLRNQRLSEKHNVFPTHFQRLSEKHNVFATHFKRLSEKHNVFSRIYVSNSLIGQYLTRDWFRPGFPTPSPQHKIGMQAGVQFFSSPLQHVNQLCVWGRGGPNKSLVKYWLGLALMTTFCMEKQLCFSERCWYDLWIPCVFVKDVAKTLGRRCVFLKDVASNRKIQICSISS